MLFGQPASVTAFFRSQRGIKSEVEDSFTIILQYDGDQSDLLVTVKTAVVTPMAQQLKQLVRGTKGSFIKVSSQSDISMDLSLMLTFHQWQQRSTCPQEEQIEKGANPLDPGFGEEPEHLRGVLTTYEEFDKDIQTYDPEIKKYTGKYPTVTGRWMGLYENLADVIRGKGELAVKATECRDVLRIIELARESHVKKTTVAWR